LQQAQSMAMYTGQREFPVVDGDKLAGYLTGRDLQSALRAHPAYMPVSSVMDRTVRPVAPETSLFEVQQRLIEEAKEGLPVVANSGRYVGMITMQHIAELLRLVQTPPIVPGTPRA
jgi:CBS domain-containing protein